MGAVADGVLEEGGEVFGIITRQLMDIEVGHEGLTELHVVETMHERKHLMASIADGFVALPGGIGTLEEIFEVLTWLQLDIHRKPCAFLNASGYFDQLLGFLDGMVKAGFLGEAHRKLALEAGSIPDVFEALEGFRSEPESKLRPA